MFDLLQGVRLRLRFLDGEASLQVGEASWYVVAGVEDKFSELEIVAFL